MFGLAIVLAAFSLMGTPSQVVPDCDPSLTTENGQTILVGSVDSGWAATRIDFSPEVCGGLLYVASPAAIQAQLRRLNPHTDFMMFSAVAMLAVLHEAHHGTGDTDEGRTECLALKALPLFVKQHALPVEVDGIVEDARLYDGGLPAVYHGATC